MWNLTQTRNGFRSYKKAIYIVMVLLLHTWVFILEETPSVLIVNKYFIIV